MSAPLRIAIAGLGRWGPVQLAAFARTPGVVVTALADPLSERLREHARPGARLVPSIDALLAGDDVDAVVLTTPASTHGELARRLLRGGRHVLIEKPLALEPKDAERCLRLATEHRRVAMMGHVLEHHPALAALDGLLRNGALGEVRHIQCRRLATRATSDDPWWTLAPHDLGLCLRFGGNPSELRLRRSKRSARAWLRFTRGTTATIEVAFGAPCRARELRLVGTLATAHLDDAPAGARLTIQPVSAETRGATFPSELEGTQVPLRFDAAPTPLDAQARAFVAACAGGPVPRRCDLAAGLEIVRWLAHPAELPLSFAAAARSGAGTAAPEPRPIR